MEFQFVATIQTEVSEWQRSVLDWQAFTFATLCVLCIATWLFMITRVCRGGQLLSSNPEIHKENPEVPWGLVDLLVIALAWILSQSIVVYLLQEKLIDDAVGRFLLSTIQLAVTLLAVFGLSQRYRIGLTQLGFPISRCRRDARVGVVCFVMVFPVLIGIQVLLNFLVEYEHPALEAIKNTDQFGRQLMYMFGTVVVAPITEEIFFRGFLQGWFQRLKVVDSIKHRFACVYGNSQKPGLEIAPPFDAVEDRSLSRWIQPTRHGVAILCTSAIFSAMHLGQGAAAIPLFVFSIALGYVVQRTGSLVPAIIAHFLLNFYTVFWQAMLSF